MPGEAIRDGLGRALRDLRISVMDRCNFRCPYCMPAATYHDAYRFLASSERLDFAEIEHIARVAAECGVTKLRLTGGEPLLRPDLTALIERLAILPGIEDVALTTNGVLLARHAASLRAAGLTRVTVSLDSLDPAIFAAMSGGRAELAAVMEGINAAATQGFPGGVKVNAVIQRDVNDTSAVPLAAHFRGTPIVLRFIEYMDVGNRNGWARGAVVPSRELHERIAALWPLDALSPRDRGEVARRYAYRDGAGEIGFISSVSDPFCGGCSRARLSSEGRLYTCLFATKGTDLRAILRDSAAPDVVTAQLRRALSGVWQARTDRYSEERASLRTERTTIPQHQKIEMHYIGG